MNNTTSPAPGIGGHPRAIEFLDFKVIVASTQADLLKTVALRHAANAHHKPEFAELLRVPEADDTAADCAVLLAERKADGVALGTMRVRQNGARPLPVEGQVALPAWLRGKRLADARRLAIAQGVQSTEVRVALFKAYFLWLRHRRVDWSVVSARKPLDRMYERLMFVDVLNGATFIPDPLLKDPHRALALEVSTAEQRWQAAQHPLMGYMCHTIHPDIDVGAGTAVVGSAPE